MWIENDSGYVINSASVREFGILSSDDGCSLWAFGVGKIAKPYAREFFDDDRHLVRNASEEEVKYVFTRLKVALEEGDTYFSCRRCLEDYRAAKSEMEEQDS